VNHRKGLSMLGWFEQAIAEKLSTAGNHVILIPARNLDAPLDTVDVYDGVTGQFIAADVPENAAQDFAIIWNELVDRGENTENLRKLNIAWLTDVKGKQHTR